MSTYTTVSFGVPDDLNLKTSGEGKEDLHLAPPPEFNGIEGVWTPEDLFSASISSCYILTFKAFASYKKVEWLNIEVKVDAELEKTPEGFKFTKVDIYPFLTICCQDNVDPYLKLLEKSKGACLVTNSMNCEFEVHPKIRVKAK